MVTSRILFFGDIFGRPGREAVQKILPAWRKEHQPDFIVANIENIAHGTGVTREKAEEMRSAGVDGFTLGDHTFDIEKAAELLADISFPIIRPLNWIGGVPGRGWRILKKNGKRLLILNVLGRVFIRIHADDPFAAVESALKEASVEGYDASLLDCHAEATSEKRAIVEAFDGRISAVIGTHTHVQTADAQTLPHGSGFLSDAGFSGPMDSVLGVKREIIIERMRTQRPAHHEPAEGPCVVCGCLITIEGGITTVKAVQERGV